ncbi:MAG: hypothetical protein EAY65_01770 [Alphaproteobacteria bacterium]|nr:MAG: hypothetical protein EAY65_01770 [Alphaproteobacteria bacterium]
MNVAPPHMNASAIKGSTLAATGAIPLAASVALPLVEAAVAQQAPLVAEAAITHPFAHRVGQTIISAQAPIQQASNLPHHILNGGGLLTPLVMAGVGFSTLDAVVKGLGAGVHQGLEKLTHLTHVDKFEKVGATFQNALNNNISAPLAFANKTAWAPMGFTQQTNLLDAHHAFSQGCAHVGEQIGDMSILGNKSAAIASNVQNFAGKLEGVEDNVGAYLGKVVTSATAAVGSAFKKMNMNGVGEAVANAPDNFKWSLKGSTLMQNTMQIGLASGMVCHDVKFAGTVIHKIEQITDMYRAITGNKDANMWQALTDKNVPNIFSHERDNFMGSLLPRTVATVGTNLMFLQSMKHVSKQSGFGSILTLMGPSLLAPLAEQLDAPLPLLDMYDLLKLEETARGAIPTELYAQTIKTFVPALQGMSINNPIVVGVAEQCAQEKLSPTQLILDIDSGDIARRVFHVEAEVYERHNAMKRKAALPTPNPSAITQVEQQGTVAALPERSLRA